MKEICVIALNLSDEILELDCDYIGVDKGALFLANNNQNMILAIGDFDSIQESDFNIIQKFSQNILKFSSHKDESDSELAIKKAIELGYQHIIVTGGLAKRIDHSLNNLLLLQKYSNIDLTFRDKDNKAYLLSPGMHMLSKSHYKYISFFPLTDTKLSLLGFEYNLNQTTLKAFNNLGLSNEIINQFGTVIIESGNLIAIQSND